MNKLTTLALTVAALTVAACADGLDHDFFHAECDPGQIGWVDEDGNPACAVLDTPHSAGLAQDPPEAPPAPTEISPECISAPPLPPGPIFERRDPDGSIDLARAPAPACPADQFLTDIRFFSGPLAVGGRRFGEHSATRITQWKATWDTTQRAYTVAEVKHNDQANHGPGPDDGNMIMYRVPIVTGWTAAGGLGETAYAATINKYCACPGPGPHPHASMSDSCYGFVAPDHVCHSDTRFQEHVFRTVSGNGIPPAVECNSGLWTFFAP